MPRPKRTPKTGDHTQNRAVSLADAIADFEDLLPGLRSAIRLGLSAEEIYGEFTQLVAARGVHIALTERDSAKALSAIRDVLDRTQGKAKERTEYTHRLEKLPEEQLDAAIKTKIAEVTAKTTKH